MENLGKLCVTEAGYLVHILNLDSTCYYCFDVWQPPRGIAWFGCTDWQIRAEKTAVVINDCYYSDRKEICL